MSNNNPEHVGHNEFQNLYADVQEIKKSVSDLCGDVKVIKSYIEGREANQKKYFTVIAVIVSVISVIVGVVMRIAV